MWQTRLTRRPGVRDIDPVWPLIAVGLVLVAATVPTGLPGWRQARVNARLAADGRTVLAAVTRHYLRAGEPRLEYRLVVDGDESTRDVVLHPAHWAALNGRPTVAVTYLPADPGLNRLAAGEGDDLPPGLPPLRLIVAIVVGVSGGLVAAGGGALHRWGRAAARR